MENKGWLKGRWVEKEGQRRHRYYRLSSKGQKVLAEQRENWRAFTTAINQVIEEGHA
jgi:DNA-binding PadR family transcriptional regulator